MIMPNATYAGSGGDENVRTVPHLSLMTLQCPSVMSMSRRTAFVQRRQVLREIFRHGARGAGRYAVANGARLQRAAPHVERRLAWVISPTEFEIATRKRQ